jgi:PAS domain S-box-containing protein
MKDLTNALLAANRPIVISQQKSMEQLEFDVLTTIVEDADANILIVDDQFKILTLNPGFYWIFYESYGIDLRPGVSIIESMELVSPRLAQVWRDRCLSATSGVPYKVEETYELDGKLFHWEIYYKRIEHNGHLLISVFSRDITLRKNYQRRILENEANLRSIFNSLENGVWLINTKLELIDFNREFYRHFRHVYGIRPVKGKNLIDLFPDHMHHRKEIWKVRCQTGLEGKPGKYYDTCLLTGEQKTYEIKTYPIKERNRVFGLTLYLRDITQQKKTEDVLKQQNEELIRINSELDRFVYSASHDLRAPLMSVKGLVNLLRHDNDAESTRKYLDLIEQSINRLDNFISDIIHHSRNSRMELLVKEINFDHLLSESIGSLKYMEGAEEVESIRDIQMSVPFYSDYSRLLIIFNNIIANAVRYRDTWKKNSFIKIEVRTDAEKAFLRFTDNGIGIAEEYLGNVFKMFFRASPESKGSGLGLYIVKSVVEKLGGQITVRSQLGSGTSFEITLPNQADITSGFN